MVAAASPLSPVSTVDAYPQSLQCLIQTLKQSTTFTPQRVSMVLKNAQVSADDLFPWADFKHPPTDSYGRQLLYHGGNFEIMVMTWLPRDFSAIHDHGSTQWGAVQCFGHADHYIYRFCDHKLRDYATAHYTPGMIRAVNHDLIHQMGNTGDEPFLSLHVYGSPTAQPDITGNARVFNLFSQTIQLTDGGVFFCLPASDINSEITGLTGDRITMLRHHQQMRDRLLRILALQKTAALVQQLEFLERQIASLTNVNCLGVPYRTKNLK